MRFSDRRHTTIRLWRRRVRWSLVVLVLVAFATDAGAKPERENILILLIDDVGIDQIGLYGETATNPPTPNIDRLAARGVLFRNAWVYPWCSPTRAAILTGRYGF